MNVQDVVRLCQTRLSVQWGLDLKIFFNRKLLFGQNLESVIASKQVFSHLPCGGLSCCVETKGFALEGFKRCRVSLGRGQHL